jgi:hypothetical protein
VDVERIDLSSLVGAWRSAFVAAECALRAARRDGDLESSELGAESRRLANERIATVAALGSLARNRQAGTDLVELVELVEHELAA